MGARVRARLQGRLTVGLVVEDGKAGDVGAVGVECRVRGGGAPALEEGVPAGGHGQDAWQSKNGEKGARAMHFGGLRARRKL